MHVSDVLVSDGASPTALPSELPRRAHALSRIPVAARVALSAMPSSIWKARYVCSWTPTAHTTPTISRSWPHRFSKGGRNTFPDRGFSVARASCTAASMSGRGSRGARSSPHVSIGVTASGFRIAKNGFRAIRTDLLKSLKLRSRHTTIEQEMIVATLRAGKTLAEVPTHEHARKAGSSHISVWRDGPSYVLSLARLML